MIVFIIIYFWIITIHWTFVSPHQQKVLKKYAVIKAAVKVVMLIASAKFRCARRTSHQPAIIYSCLTISHICFPCLPSGRVSSCVRGVIEGKEDAWGAVNVGCRWVASLWNLQMNTGGTGNWLSLNQGGRNLTCWLLQLNPRAQEEHPTIQLSWVAAWAPVTNACPVHPADKLIPVFYVP